MAEHSHSFSPCCAHDHQACVQQALLSADQLCAARGVRLTELRRRVLELLWVSHKPLGAYDLLEALSRQDERRAAPPTVYRALEFLLENGLIHRLASLNAFIGCPKPGAPHHGQFLICQNCRTVLELNDGGVSERIEQCARNLGFAAQSLMVEVAGCCAHCQEQPCPSH